MDGVDAEGDRHRGRCWGQCGHGSGHARMDGRREAGGRRPLRVTRELHLSALGVGNGVGGLQVCGCILICIEYGIV